MVDRLLSLQEWGRPLINGGRAHLAAAIISDSENVRKEITALYSHYFGKTVTGCKNCYADALIELCTIKKSKAMSKTNLFVMRRGKVLKDTINRDARYNLARGAETEDLALYHLYTNPTAHEYFETLPDEDRLAEMLEAYGEEFEAKRNARFGTGTGVTAADKVLNDANAKAAAILENAESAETEAQKIIDAANAKADEIVAAANDEAERVKGEAEQAANAKADEIVAAANDEAVNVVENAKTEAAEIVAKAKAKAKALKVADAEAAEMLK